jgi:hypothetical protein
MQEAEEVIRMPEVIYDRTFYQNGTEARAVIVDYSDPGHVEFRFGITERPRSFGAKAMVTFQKKLEERCSEIPHGVRSSFWGNLYQQAKDELNREIRIAADPHYDLPERELY